MGYASYSVDSRTSSVRHMMYNDVNTKTDQIFTQNAVGKIHESMSPLNLAFREARDSEKHPVSFPIIIALDVTGSMGIIPEMLIKNGLPHLMSKLIEAGCKDAAVLFLAIGDHYCDQAPLQVGQFESGDEELDMWLTRTWLEGNGGGNGGESYALAWIVAANHTKTDHWEKRGQKGVLITIGDEPIHYEYNHLKSVFGTGYEGTNAKEALKQASKSWNIFHLAINNQVANWRPYLEERVIPVSNYDKVPDEIARIVLANMPVKVDQAPVALTEPPVTEETTPGTI